MGSKWALIVEDDEGMKDALMSFFQDYGYHCVVASTVQAALDHITQEKFDKAIVDYHMPSGGNPCDVVAKLKQKGCMAIGANSNVEISNDLLVLAGATHKLDKKADKILAFIEELS